MLNYIVNTWKVFLMKFARQGETDKMILSNDYISENLGILETRALLNVIIINFCLELFWVHDLYPHINFVLTCPQSTKHNVPCRYLLSL